MSTAVLHVAADDDSSTAVAAWIEAHGCECWWCADAFDAVVLLRTAGHPAGLAFLATDRLSPDEVDLFPLIGTAWPATVVVAYGGGRLAAAAALPRGTIWCDTPAALEKILRHRPDELIRHFSGPGAFRGVQTASPGGASLMAVEATASAIRSASAEIIGISRAAAAAVGRR